jgi:hypothetical protein
VSFGKVVDTMRADDRTVKVNPAAALHVEVPPSGDDQAVIAHALAAVAAELD